MTSGVIMMFRNCCQRRTAVFASHQQATAAVEFAVETSPAVFAELFPASVRYSGASLSNTLGTILGGAPAPFIAAALYDRFASSMAVGLYITVMATVSWISVVGLKETRPSGEP